ncbi:hypothetical protein [Rhodococcus sp. 24CO]|uniref:hypothetical protein n=1 Tax=Rhodococcus sp. 24CO TaxID=3117460 RepID=UPI003D336EAC
MTLSWWWGWIHGAGRVSGRVLGGLAPVLAAYDGEVELERGLDILFAGLAATLTNPDNQRTGNGFAVDAADRSGLRGQESSDRHDLQPQRVDHDSMRSAGDYHLLPFNRKVQGKVSCDW